ncbi:MAG: hypothetical protein HUJ61_07500 [Bacilli bacterium]|nr:hypothetical protein [Bacilli bacterium]
MFTILCPSPGSPTLENLGPPLSVKSLNWAIVSSFQASTVLSSNGKSFDLSLLHAVTNGVTVATVRTDEAKILSSFMCFFIFYYYIMPYI